MKLLIVEDDLLLQEGLALALGNEGYALDCAATAAEADALIQSGEYSLVILDGAARSRCPVAAFRGARSARCA
ncbi:hypothetical protein AWI13_05125 [Enterobacter hormaechei subsp. xiangfangensis]|nr:hypothetical protein AWI13_05125 [Enterobacter hormaechei subsp. xiangfangensis]